MIPARSTSLVTVSLLCLVAMPASGAWGATKKKTTPRPTVRSVAPMTAGVGDQLTIRGRNFQLGRNRNTVFFKTGSKPAVAVKAGQATRTTMKVIVPKTVEKYLTVKDGAAQPTRFRLRVLAKRFGASYTAASVSPRITLGNAASSGLTSPTTGPAADCDADGIINSVDPDDDNDLLSDALEGTLKLNACNADSDGDGVEDGYEYYSAADLNNTVGQNLPYPGKRPYPNPLDASDPNTDYDGDGLGAAQEQLMWKAYGGHALPLSYSAGLKKTDGVTNDGNRDVDSDGLQNWDEFNGRMQPTWWLAFYKNEKPYTESYDGTSAVDPDSDGDSVLDGADDTDHDLWTNVEEINRSTPVGAPRGDGVSKYRVQPFNPCLPDYTSPTCSEHPPIENSYPPFDAALPPAPIVIP